jgi:cytochrome c peroxidase
VLASQWWVAAGDRRLPSYAWFRTAAGAVAIDQAAGPVETGGHPFFAPQGSNGRACVTCHQPADGMSLSLNTIRARWSTTGGRDPLFAAVDGADCPGSPRTDESSHRLLLSKGLFRIALPWPPRSSLGEVIEPEFELEVISDPTGCNLDPAQGLKSPHPEVSVFRRPRMAANLSYVEAADGAPSTLLMADGRAANLVAQMDDAALHHLESGHALDPSSQRLIRDFERQLYSASAWHREGGSLDAGGAALGTAVLREGKNAATARAVPAPFPEISGWVTKRSLAEGVGAWSSDLPEPPLHRVGEAQESAAVRGYRDAVARGYVLFMARPFVGDDGRPQTCATCHNGLHTGIDVTGGHPGLGVSLLDGGLPAEDLPLFRATCRDGVAVPRAGAVIYTHDPGRALVTGRCADLGEVNAQQLRALAARPPYFTGGSAATLRAVVEYYDRRFAIGYTPADVDALVRFLEAL